MNDPTALLLDPEVCPSVAWPALRALVGHDPAAWEPDTIRLELTRRAVPATDGLLAKLLGAQTIATTTAWTFDHDVVFAFALACDGVPAASDALHHPTPEQLAWGVREIDALADRPTTDDEGFDPDGVDPAVAALLLHDGLAVAPGPLAFCQGVLDDMTPDHAELRAQVRQAWDAMQELDAKNRVEASRELPEDALGIQLRRRCDIAAYVAEREQLRARQRALLPPP